MGVSQEIRERLLVYAEERLGEDAYYNRFKILTEDAAKWLNEWLDHNWGVLSGYLNAPGRFTNDDGELKPIEVGSDMFLGGEDIITIIGSMIQDGNFKIDTDFTLVPRSKHGGDSG